MVATKRFGRRLGTRWEPDLISGAGRARPEGDVPELCGGLGLGFWQHSDQQRCFRLGETLMQPKLCCVPPMRNVTFSDSSLGKSLFQ